MRHIIIYGLIILSLGQACMRKPGNISSVNEKLPRSKAETLFYQAQRFLENNYIDSAYYYFTKSMETAMREKDSLWLAKIYYEMARIDMTRDYLNLSEFHAVNGLKNLPAGHQNDLYRGLFYNILGLTLNKRGLYDQALNYFHKYRNSYQRFNDTTRYYISYQNNLGSVYINKKEWDKALVYYENILHLDSLLQKYPSSFGFALHNKANILFKSGQAEKALEPLEKSLQISKKQKDNKRIWADYMLLAEIMKKLNRKKEALYYARQALALSRRMNLQNKELETLRFLIANDSSATKQQYLNRYFYLVDNFRKKESQTKDFVLRIVYETAEKDRKIFVKNFQIIQYKSRLRVLSIFFGAMALLLGVILISYRKIKRKNITIARQAESLEMLYQEMHHRVKNNFNMFISFVMNIKSSLKNENADIDKQLENIAAKMKSFIEIHDSLRLHMKDSKNLRRFNLKILVEKIFYTLREMAGRPLVKLNCECDDSASLRTDHIFLTGMIIHEFITNAFKHAFVNKKDRGEISIRFFSDGDDYILEMKNSDSKKHSQKEPQQSEKGHISSGLKLIRLFHMQLDGGPGNGKAERIVFNNRNGFEIKMYFKKPKNK